MVYKLVSSWGPQFRSPKWHPWVPMSQCAFSAFRTSTRTHTYTRFRMRWWC